MSALDILIALFAAIGILAALWLVIGKLLTPASPTPSGLFQVLPASGDGCRLEGQVRGILWQNCCQGLSCPLIVADCGLDEEGQQAARCLARRWPEVQVYKAEELGWLAEKLGSEAEA